jgi:hypothetical protein
MRRKLINIQEEYVPCMLTQDLKYIPTDTVCDITNVCLNKSVINHHFKRLIALRNSDVV